ncbi:MAG: DMT family transporter [Fibrobacteria bacterium]
MKLGLSAVIAASVLFSAKSVFFKLCYRYGTPPVVLQALRSVFSTPFYFWPFLIHRFRPAVLRPAPLSRRDMAIIVWLGFSGYYLASIFDMVGLQYVSAGTERLILYIYPTLVVIFSALIFRKRIPRSLFLPLGLSYAGIALSFGGEVTGVPAGDAGGRPFYGGSLIFLSAVFYALFLVWQGRLVGRLGPQRLAAGCMMVSSFFVLAQFLLCYPVDALAQPGPVLAIAFFTAVFCNVLPVYLYGYGVNLVGAGKAAVVSSVGPVSTLVLAGGLLGEGAGILQFAGLALVVGGTLKLGMGKPAQVPAAQASTRSSLSGPEASSVSPVAAALPDTVSDTVSVTVPAPAVPVDVATVLIAAVPATRLAVVPDSNPGG